MKLDFFARVNVYGESMVRLYDSNKEEAEKFRRMIMQCILSDKMSLDLSTLDFIQLRNCNLILRISETDEGIASHEHRTFFCDLTIESYERMVSLLEPFCKKETIGHQFLYDVDTPTDFLFSPGGTW